MWLAVIISICFATEVLSFLSGGGYKAKKEQEEFKNNAMLDALNAALGKK